MRRTSLAAAIVVAAAFAHPLSAQVAEPVLDSAVYHGRTRQDLPRELTLVAPGMHVRLLNPDSVGYRRAGVLSRVTADSIFLTRADGVTVGREVQGLDGIEISRGRSQDAGTLRGAIVGAVVGGILLPASGLNHDLDADLSLKTLVRPLNFLLGGLVGAGFGALNGVELWKRAADATPEELAASARVANPPSGHPRFVVAAYAGGVGSRDVEVLTSYKYGTRRPELPIVHRLDRAGLLGIDVEAPGYRRFGLLAGASYTLGSGAGQDSNRFVTSDHHVLMVKLGTSIHLPTSIPTSVRVAPVWVHESADPGDWFTGSASHFGADLGIAADVPVAPTSRVRLRLGVDDNVVRWNRATFEQRFRAKYPNNDVRLMDSSLSHLVSFSAGLAYPL